jgi:hypothetical protein
MINECGCGCGGAVGGCMNESPKELESYMFFGNLQTIKRAVDAMLEMDPQQVDAILQDGHNWAADHIATSKDDIEEVAGFMMNRMEQEEPHEEAMVPFVHTFESFVNESFKKHYGKEISVEEFKSIGTGDQVLYRGKRWNVVEANEYVLHLEDDDGRKKTVNRNQFKEYGAITEAKKPVKKKAKRDQDGDGDTDFADAKIAQYKAGGLSQEKAVKMSRKFNR